MQQQVAPPMALPRYERILYAMDGSPSSRQAGSHAVYLAQRSQAQLIVLYVMPDSITSRLSLVLRGAWSEERRLARQAADDLVKLARASGVQALSSVESGPGCEVIDRAAVRFEADLVVVSLSQSNTLHTILGPMSPGGAPLWRGRPVLVILCKEGER